MEFRYRTKTRQFVCTIIPLQSSSTANFLSSCNDFLFSAQDNGEVLVWKYTDTQRDWNLYEETSTTCLEFVKQLALTDSSSKNASILSVVSWERQGRKFVINATSSGVVSFWNPFEIGLSSLVHKGKAHGNSINALTVWNDWLVTGSSDNTLKVWNMEINPNKTNDTKESSIQVVKLVKMLAGHFGSVNAAICIEKMLWTGGRDRTIRIWNPNGFKTVNVVQAHKGTITSLCEWRGHIVSGSYDKTIKIWNKEGKNVKNLNGHQCWVTCLCVWKERLCSGSKDKTIRIWSWNGDCISTMIEDEGIKSLHVWRDLLWSTSGESIRCWKPRVSWSVLRVLWIGLMKNRAADCVLALLPNEILKEVISCLIL
mmetsp:Transcript_14226/g.19827  ORF Transcript_14226/g.19827 Transcript_14226/m.19827 type:complete len:369 (+) Transcript_14226:27-1133(+)